MRRTRGLIALVAAFAVIGVACGGDGGEGGGGNGGNGAGNGDGAESQIWYMVTDQAGLGDQGFNDLAFAGVSQAAEELGGEAKVIESSEQAQYVPNLTQAVSAGAALTVGVGFLIADAVHEVAVTNPDARFVLIDAVAADDAGTPDDFSDDTPDQNVQSVLFKEHEAAFLAGIIAGMTTESNQLGFVGGIEIPPVVRFLMGFQAALQTVNPDANVEVAYVGSFDDPARVKEVTNSYYDTGADVVFEVAGAGGLGAYEAAKERGAGAWVMGTDTCKDQLAPDNFLTSANKDVAGSVFKAAQAVADGSFEGGILTYGLAEDGVGVCQDTFGDLPQEVQDAVNQYSEMIKAGDLVVPGTPEELEGFTPPAA